MGNLKFGWSEVDITPTEKIALRGEFFERVTNEVETPISITSLAIEGDGDQVVFCSCDLVGVEEDLMDLTKQILKERNVKGLDIEKIVASAIHTHNSYNYGSVAGASDPSVLKLFPEGCTYIPEEHDPDQMSAPRALAFLGEKLADAVELAWNNRKPGGFAPGFGRAAVGMNRRVCYSDGTAAMWGDVEKENFTELEGGNDNGIEMMFVYDENKNLTGVVANLACPSQVLEQRSIISGDFWGKVKILLREKYGKDLYLLSLCAPAGDQCPRDLIRWVEPETPIKDPNVIRNHPKYRRADPSMFDVRGTWTIGRRIMNEISFALESVEEIQTEAILSHSARDIYLPLRRVTEEDKIKAEKAIADFFVGKTKINFMDTAALYVYTGTLHRYEEQKTRDKVRVNVHNVRLGDIAFSSDPFELFLNYGNQIRAHSPAAQTFLIQLANGELGYLPTALAEAHGHYSAYVSSGYVGHEGGAILVEKTLEDLNELFKD
ncbi:MAG: hypothetical protein IJR88_03570 [Clostridia bacterium]|nr:hypothetical protein [Clostridia bacterium]